MHKYILKTTLHCTMSCDIILFYDHEISWLMVMEMFADLNTQLLN